MLTTISTVERTYVLTIILTIRLLVYKVIGNTGLISIVTCPFRPEIILQFAFCRFNSAIIVFVEI